MNVDDLIPASGHVQRLYCDACEGYLELAYTNWEDDVSGTHLLIEGLPVLRCHTCKKDHLPDLSRYALIRTHEKAVADGWPSVSVKRKKRTDDFNLSKVSFLYEADDYFYLPGLYRQHDVGFLTPLFFNRHVLLKYEMSPEYTVEYASSTYGTIYTPGRYIAFGINRHGKVIMWLGDVARLPESEQYYLRSENVESDHAIGSEFYDGQIEVKYTAKTAEDVLLEARSKFTKAFFVKFGRKVAHLDEKVLDLALSFNAPVVDTPKERHHVADALNKIYLESLDNAGLAEVMVKLGIEPKKVGTGSLKRLQAIMEGVAPTADIYSLMTPLYVLYDFRVAYSHLASQETDAEALKKVQARLGLDETANLFAIHEQLVARITASFEKMAELLG